MTSSTSRRSPLDIGQVKVSGWLGERIDRGIVAVDNLFGSLWWHGSMWGYEHVARWIRNQILYGRYSGRFHPAIPGVKDALLGLVADGRAFARYAENALAAYNEEEFLMGLLSHYEHYRETAVLDAATRIASSIAGNHRILAGNHYYKSLAIVRLLDLVRLGGDKTFLSAAIEIAGDQKLAMLKVEGQGENGNFGGTHGAAACMILCAHVDLFEATGDKRYMDWAVHSWQAIRERMFITGGIGEHLRFLKPPEEGQDLHDETCQHSWWLMANFRLWHATGEARYLDMAERIIYNHLLFSQLHLGEDAGFCALGNVDQGFRGQHNYICCDNEGFLALIETARRIVTSDAARREASVNLLVPATCSLPLGGKEDVRLSIETDYPINGRVTVRVETGQPARFTLKVRVPGGQAPASFTMNGGKADVAFEGGYVSSDRVWKNGDALNIVFPIAMRAEADNTGSGAKSAPVILDGRQVPAKRIGVFHGPVLAVLFRTGHGNDLNWVWTGDYPEVLDSGGCVFENYPTSKSDYLQAREGQFDTGRAADRTEVTTTGRAPLVRWSHTLNGRVVLSQEVRIHPGLPVTMDWTERIKGLGEGESIQCSGMRFGVAKRSISTYGNCGFPYPFPAVTTRDDLSANVGFVAGGGSFSLAEKLEDGAALEKTGTYRLSNGYFRAICHYDKAEVARVVGRVAKEWAGIYFEPQPGATMLTRRLVFPLAQKPLNQDLTLLETKNAKVVRFNVERGPGAQTTVEISGPLVQDMPLIVPRSTGLRAGWLLHNATHAAVLLDWDAGNLVVRLPAPGTYAVTQLPA